MMHFTNKLLLLIPALAFSAAAEAQTQFGIKVGGNFLITSQSISPTPKDAPPTPKGLGLQFGAYAKVPFSDMVGLRPEIGFSFRRAKSDQSITTNVPVTDQNGVEGGRADLGVETKTDQRLQYFQIAAPLTLNATENFRVMVGPAIGFLMGGKLNQDVTTTVSNGTFNGQPFKQDPTFTSTVKKGSAATKDFKKAEVAVVAGLGYELDMGLDFDLRYYRAIVPTQDISQPSFRYKSFSNMIELSLGYTFGS
ncbi:MAG: outer membrane beta-barrel protein [Flavobacteriales bacterium]